MMFSGLRVSCARPAAATFISLRCVFISLARTSRSWRSEDFARLRQAKPEPTTEMLARMPMIERSQRSRVQAARNFSVDIPRTKPCNACLAIKDWYSVSSMFRSQNGRPRGRPSREKRFVSVGGLNANVLLAGATSPLAVPDTLFDAPGTLFELPVWSDRGSRRGNRVRKPSGLFVNGDESTTVGFVLPSEVSIAPRSTGFTRTTVSRFQRRSPVWAISVPSMGSPAETTGSLAALSRTIETISLDLTSSFVRLTISFIIVCNRSCETVPLPRNRIERMMALSVLAIYFEPSRSSVFAASRTRRCSSTCQTMTSAHTATSKPYTNKLRRVRSIRVAISPTVALGRFLLLLILRLVLRRQFFYRQRIEKPVHLVFSHRFPNLRPPLLFIRTRSQ